jgi:hypothetical protein
MHPVETFELILVLLATVVALHRIGLRRHPGHSKITRNGMGPAAARLILQPDRRPGGRIEYRAGQHWRIESTL